MRFRVRPWLLLLVGNLACGDGSDGTDYVPPARPAPATTLTISTAEELASLRSLKRVEGNLELTGEALAGDLDLPELTEITGWLRVHDDALSTLSLPALARVLDIEVRDSPLTVLAVPAVRELYRLTFAYGSAVTTLEAPALRELEILEVGAALEALDLPRLERVGLFAASDEPLALTRITAPRLTTVDMLSVFPADALSALELPALATAGSLFIRSRSLDALVLPALSYAEALDAALAEEATVDLPALTDAGALSFQAGTTLDLRLDALRSVSSLYAAPSSRDPEASVATRASVPSLSVAGGLTLWGQAGSFELPALEDVGELQVEGALSSLSAPALVHAGRLVVAGDQLTELSLPALERAGLVLVPLSQLTCDVGALFPKLAEPELAITPDESCP